MTGPPKHDENTEKTTVSSYNQDPKTPKPQPVNPHVLHRSNSVSGMPSMENHQHHQTKLWNVPVGPVEREAAIDILIA
jgi:hypothetical protein